MKQLSQQLGWRLEGESKPYSGVCTDTRQLKGGELFVALAGEQFDAHDFIASAEKSGAVGAVVSRDIECGIPTLHTDDTLRGLGEIARLHRRQFNGKVFAITGSAGKTTTKEMLAAVMAAQGKVLATQGNLNNEIGVPLTLLRLEGDEDYAVVEMGAAKAGDIGYLVDIAEPDISLLTNAMSAHLEGFGSIEQVVRTKGEIFVDRPDCVAVINLDDMNAEYWIGSVKQAKVFTVSAEGNPAASIYASAVRADAQGSEFTLHSPAGEANVSLQVPGLHNISNALLAIAAALSTDMPLNAIVKALGDFGGVEGRMQRRQRQDGLCLIDDTYNANPQATRAAIDVLALQGGKKAMVLGNMAELGADSDALHAGVGSYAAGCGIDLFVTIGSDAAHAAQGFGPAALSFKDFESARDWFVDQGYLHGYQCCLVKGSRSARMERVVELLVTAGGEAA